MHHTKLGAPPPRYTKKDLVVWALGRCGGDSHPVDTETVGVYLFELGLSDFALKKYTQYPDIDVTRVQLHDAKKNKESEPARVEQDTDARKREARQRGDARRILSRDPRWQLNAAGLTWYRGHSDAVEKQVQGDKSLGVRRAPNAVRLTATRLSSAVLSRIRGRSSFQAFCASPDGTCEVSIHDFFAVFNVDAYTPDHGYVSAKAKVLEAVAGCDAERRYVQLAADRFGSRYRTALDELLTGEA